MNQEHFDELAKGLATNRFSRGQVLKMVAGALLGSALGGSEMFLGAGEAEARKRRRRRRLDLPTVDSLRAARAKLAAGATDVAVSPRGRFRYRRTYGVFVSSEELSEADVPVLVWNHSRSVWGLGKDESIGQGDADRDGFFESRTTIVRGQSVTDQRMEVLNYSPQTQALIRRETYTRTGTDTIHVVRERDDGTGNLVIEAEFDTTLTQDVEADDSLETSQQPPEPVSSAASGCTDTQGKQLDQLLQQAVNRGYRCMYDKGEPDIGNKVMAYYLRRHTIFDCTPIGEDAIAQQNWWESVIFGIHVVAAENIEITVDPKFWNLSTEEQQETLWHEMLHIPLGGHNLDLKKSNSRWIEIDRVYACGMLCFNVDYAEKTKCSCARCLGTDACDERCKDYIDCDSDMGSGYSVKCNCPSPKEECNGQCLDPCPAGQERNPVGCWCQTSCSGGTTCYADNGEKYCCEAGPDYVCCPGPTWSQSLQSTCCPPDRPVCCRNDIAGYNECYWAGYTCCPNPYNDFDIVACSSNGVCCIYNGGRTCCAKNTHTCVPSATSKSAACVLQ